MVPARLTLSSACREAGFADKRLLPCALPKRFRTAPNPSTMASHPPNYWISRQFRRLSSVLASKSDFVSNLRSCNVCRRARLTHRSRAAQISDCTAGAIKSLERTDEACRKIEDSLNKTPRVQYTTSVVGFTLLSLVQTPTARFSSSPQAMEPADDAGLARSRPASPILAPHGTPCARESPVEIGCCANQRQVRKRLGKIAKMPAVITQLF
jgi:hypothetical protein